jgi:hypothetical protein
VELPDGLTGIMKAGGNLLLVDHAAATGKNLEWKVFF